jgi:hypothetical protein
MMMAPEPGSASSNNLEQSDNKVLNALKVRLSLKVGLSATFKRIQDGHGRSLDPLDRKNNDSSLLIDDEDLDQYAENVRRVVGLRDFEFEKNESKVKKKAIAWGKGKAIRDAFVL